jgi:hypothetical protein
MALEIQLLAWGRHRNVACQMGLIGCFLCCRIIILYTFQRQKWSKENSTLHIKCASQRYKCFIISKILPKKIWMQFWPFVFSIFSSICWQYSNVTCRPVHFMGKWLHEWILIQGQKQSVSTCLQSWLWCLLKNICEVLDNCRHSTDISRDEASFNR